MDLTTILTSIGFSVGGAWWLARALVNHKLSKDLESYKSEWKRELEIEKLNMEGKVRERIETILADRAADREYELEARKRLYQLIGPPKFQLLTACRDASRRIQEHGQRTEYSTDLEGYYGRSTLYRILRPLALSEIIEHHVAFADFAVDSAAIDLLIFKRSAFRAFTGGAVIAKHPDEDWHYQSQHVFYDTLSQAAQFLVSEWEDVGKQVVSFDQFNAKMESDLDNPGIKSFAYILHDFKIKSKPIFWQRLVAYAHICREHIRKHGVDLRFDCQPLPISSLLLKTEDKFVIDNLDKCQKAIMNAPLEKL